MRRTTIFLLAVLTAVAAEPRRVDAHKPVTSKYTYRQDVYPIFRQKCAACHRPNGAAPMSLLTYEEAFPWAESIRAELVAGHMPPGVADPTFGAIQHNAVLTARETDVILTWATGGNPRGPQAASPPTPSADAEWPMGSPDLVLKLPETVTLPADRSEDIREFVITPAVGTKWIRAVDVRPGSAAIVRNVTVAMKVESAATADGGESVLCRWTPGRVPVDVALADAAFRLPEGAPLAVRVHYQKTWQQEGKTASDNTTIGLYFATSAKRPVKTIRLDAPQPLASGADAKYTVDVPRDVDALSVRVDEAPGDELIQVAALEPDGKTVPLVRFTERPHWERRYWFTRPIAIAHGSRIQVLARYRDPALIEDAFGGVTAAAARAVSTPLRVSLDVADRSQ